MFIYGLAMIGMGIQAYFFPHEGGKPSWISLAAAGGIGAVVVAMAVLAGKMKVPRVPYIVAMVIAVLALLRFAGKLIKEQQIYPAGVTVALSVLLIAVLLGGHLMAMSKRKAATETTPEH